MAWPLFLPSEPAELERYAVSTAEAAKQQEQAKANPGDWRQKLSRAELTSDFYARAIAGVPCVVLGLWLLATAHGDGFNTGLALLLLVGGVAAIYSTLRRLGWIGR
jgi:hypothetical protein